MGGLPIDIPVCSTSLTASARNSGEYNPFGNRSILILQIVNYMIRRTPLFPAYLSLAIGVTLPGNAILPCGAPGRNGMNC